ncbi:MAG: thioredoxin [Betaproteobacteria bacterium]|nr:thioredoxin [Betaproteobacteria bacterium]
MLVRMISPAATRKHSAPMIWILHLVTRSLLGFLMQPAAAAELPYATDLARHAEEAADHGKVLVVLYGTRTCPWCAKVRQNYLAPLTRNPELAKRLAIIEVDPEVTLPLNDFAGQATNHRAFAGAQRVRMVPTVQFYGKGGVRLADPLVGMPSEDFYGTYLDQRLAVAAERIKKMP